MDENYKLYAKPLDKNNIYELKYSLNQLMDVLSEQNNCVRFVKNSLKSDRLNQDQVYNKLTDLLIKFEDLINNETKTINSFLIDISTKKLIEINDSIKNRYEEIRNNFNKIMTNLNKMLDSNPEIKEIKENYYSNRTPSKSQRQVKARRESNDETVNKVNDYNDSIEENNSYDINNKTSDNLDILENHVSTLYKNISSSNYKNKTSSIPKKPLSKNSSVSNISIQKDEKIKNIKTFHNEKVYFQNLQSFLNELEHIKDFCRNLQKTQQEYCLMANERKNFEKMKSDVIKISSDVNIIKDEFQEINSIFKQISNRISNLEDENNNLKNQNKNLIKNIKQASTNPIRNDYISVEDDYYSDSRPIKGTNMIGIDGNLTNSKLPFQSNNENTNTNNNIINKGKSREVAEEPNMSGFSDLNSMQNNSSIEMNLNLKTNTQNLNQGKNSKARFLIPK